MIRSRTVPPQVISHFSTKISSLQEDVEDVLAAEEVARVDRIAEIEATRARNIIVHADEINARKPREWFQSKKEREEVQEAARQEATKKGDGKHR